METIRYEYFKPYDNSESIAKKQEHITTPSSILIIVSTHLTYYEFVTSYESWSMPEEGEFTGKRR